MHIGSTGGHLAHLLLGKWHEEQTPVFLVLSAGSPPTSARLNMPGLIAELEPDLVISHARGLAAGSFRCPWSDVTALSYTEMREDAEKLTGYPGAPDFMRNRSILAIHAKPNLLIQLVDLTLTF